MILLLFELINPDNVINAALGIPVPFDKSCSVVALVLFLQLQKCS
jgi:hypothetical protein